MELEDRYIVLKRSDLQRLSPANQKALSAICLATDKARAKRGAPPLTCVVIESDWKIFPATVKLLRDFIEKPWQTQPVEVKHSHYKKDIRHLQMLDIYRILELWGDIPHAIGHAIKKLMVPGKRGGGKDVERDYREAVDSINRQLQMYAEDENKQ